jgi:hypothetical protein
MTALSRRHVLAGAATVAAAALPAVAVAAERAPILTTPHRMKSTDDLHSYRGAFPLAVTVTSNSKECRPNGIPGFHGIFYIYNHRQLHALAVCVKEPFYDSHPTANLDFYSRWIVTDIQRYPKDYMVA